MKTLGLAGAAALVLALAAPAHAQHHDGHAMPGPAPEAPPPADDPPPPALPEHGPAMAPHAASPAVHDHAVMPDPGGHAAPIAGAGSGTARLPTNETMAGVHLATGEDAMLMLHGYLWGVYTDQTGPRGDDKLNVQSMAMAEYQRTFAGGRFAARAMMSLEPAMRHDGYPNLFATGETAYGRPLIDRQHPHDLFMELSARLDFDIPGGATAFVYGGPVAEPALGPSAFMHRASARYSPEAPITHHWFDSTHIVYGVVTAGVAAPRWQLEASAFRGREPDEYRWNIETPKLDSWSLRASFAPTPEWLVQVSHGRLKEPEALHAGQDERRTTASVHYNNGKGFAAMAAFSAKDRVPGSTLTAWLAEANWDITRGHTLFVRFESVATDELFPDHAHPLHDRTFRVTKLQAGYAYRLPIGPAELALGGSLAGFIKPDVLDRQYGGDPMGYTVFARLSLGR